MSDLATLAPAGGVGVTLAMVVLYLLRANNADRAAYQDAVDRAEQRADRAEQRAAALDADLDAARRLRRQAEDDRATSDRQLADLRHRIQPDGELAP